MKKLGILLILVFVASLSISCANRCENCEVVVKKTVLRGVNFDFNKFEIKKNAYSILAKDIEVLKENPEYKVHIDGHCDAIGSVEYNNKLSVKRAYAVYKYFIAKGIEKSRMDIRGYGKSKPLVSNTTDENRYKNRRVEINIVKKLK